MNITFNGKFKSINDFTWENIPALTVLTGINGAGKSQLLDLLYDSCINFNNNNKPSPNIAKEYTIEINNIGFETIKPLFWGPNGMNIVLENTLFGFEDLKIFIQVLMNDIQGKHNENDQIVKRTSYPNNEGNSARKWLLRSFYNKKDKVLERIEQLTAKPRIDLTPAELSYFFPEDIVLEGYDLFNQDGLDIICFMYLYKKKAIEKYKLNIPISKIPPWEIFNQVLKSANLPYQIAPPSEDLVNPIFDNALNDINIDRFQIKLIDPNSKQEIGFKNLSSGEKTIASLSLLLYYGQSRNFSKNFLLLDEPDAHLHPTLTKQFFDVITDVILEKYDGRVIMTTHSPSTVALAPNESIYIMNRTGERIEKSSKDKALKILSYGLPAFSVNYENRRQVFVESPNDVIYYEKIYQKLSPFLEPEISLSFISSGESRTDKNGIKQANCDQVINITTTLRESGNKFIWGIIDRDKNNKSSKFIKVNGEDNRYNIENYLFDPILITALLLREKMINRQDIGLLESENYTDFNYFDSGKLQSIISFFLDKVSGKFDLSDKNTSKTTLLNGTEVYIPNWYLNHPGHELENKILETFPELNAIKKKQEALLKIAILERVIDDIPEIMPIDFLETFQFIQK